MKKLRYYIIACTASLAFLTACDNAEYNVIDNAIYLEEPSLSASNNTKLTVDGEVTTTSITARLGCRGKRDRYYRNRPCYLDGI